ncbi:hypothetical protein OH77DRAFT_1508655 [Trametes cingulata]|nr:hypothetical protein OH77DRAFT_1508655 [Trametes cingulata]
MEDPNAGSKPAQSKPKARPINKKNADPATASTQPENQAQAGGSGSRAPESRSSSVPVVAAASEEGESEVEVAEATKKKGGKGAGKGKGKKKDDDDDDDECSQDEDEKKPRARKPRKKAEPRAKSVKAKERDPKLKVALETEATQKVNKHEQARAASKALLGYAFCSLAQDQPYVKISFQDVNKRAQIPSKVTEISKSFLNGIENWRNPMPILVHPDDVEPGSYQMRPIDSPDGPRLVWTARAKGKWIIFLNGQHRTAALRARARGLAADATLTQEMLEQLLAADRDPQQRAEAIEHLKTVKGTIDRVQDGTMEWVVALYDETQIGENEACLVYLASNDVTATYKATPEERLQNCHFACLQKKVEYEKAGRKLVPGSEDWKKLVVNPIVGVNDPNRRGWDKLFTSARAFQFLTTAFKFTFFGDGKTTKLQELRDRLVRPRVDPKTIDKARRHEVVGGMWSSVIEMQLEEMLDIARAAYWPISDGDGNITDAPSDDHWRNLKRFAKMWQRRDKIDAAKLNESFAHYKSIRDVALEGAPIEQKEIWHPTLMDEIDELYVKILHPFRNDYGRMSSENWKRASEEYWRSTETLCATWWTDPPHGPASAATLLAKQHALAKFRWYAFRRKMGHTINLPLPTKSSIADMYDVLHEASFGIQYPTDTRGRAPAQPRTSHTVRGLGGYRSTGYPREAAQISRIMDPLVDKAITGTDGDMYDHTSHMHVYIQDPVMMGHKPVNGVLHMWQWIFAHLQDLQEADLEMQQVVKVEDTRFFNIMMNSWRPIAKALADNKMDYFKSLTKFWIAAFNANDGWQDYDTEDVKTINTHFRDAKYGPESRPNALVVPAKPLGDRIIGRRSEHQLVPPIPQVFVDKNKATRLLTRTLIEWRAVDSHNIGADFMALAIWVYVARAIYDRVTKHMLGTSVGVRLREDWLEFLQVHWSPGPGQPKTDSNPQPKRPQWDSKHVEELMLETPAPPKDRAEALDLQAKKDEVARWDQYNQDVKNITNAVKKSVAARAFPGDKQAVNPAVAAALDNLIFEITRNANRLEHCRLHPEGGVYVHPGASLRLLTTKPLVTAADPLVFASMEEFQAHAPAAYNAFAVNRKAHHLKLLEEKAKNPKLKILELADIRPQHIAPLKSDPGGDVEEQEKDTARALQAQKHVSSAFFEDLDFSDDDDGLSQDSRVPSRTATPVVMRLRERERATAAEGKGRADAELRDTEEPMQADGDGDVSSASEQTPLAPGPSSELRTEFPASSHVEPDIEAATAPSQNDFDKFLDSPLFPKDARDDMDFDTPVPIIPNSPPGGATIGGGAPAFGHVLVPETPAASQVDALQPEASSQNAPSSPPPSTPTPAAYGPARGKRASSRTAAASKKRAAVAPDPEEQPAPKRNKPSSSVSVATSKAAAKTRAPRKGKGTDTGSSARPKAAEHEEVESSDREFEDVANDTAV